MLLNRKRKKHINHSNDYLRLSYGRELQEQPELMILNYSSHSKQLQQQQQQPVIAKEIHSSPKRINNIKRNTNHKIEKKKQINNCQPEILKFKQNFVKSKSITISNNNKFDLILPDDKIFNKIELKQFMNNIFNILIHKQSNLKFILFKFIKSKKPITEALLWNCYLIIQIFNGNLFQTLIYIINQHDTAINNQQILDILTKDRINIKENLFLNRKLFLSINEFEKIITNENIYNLAFAHLKVHIN